MIAIADFKGTQHTSEIW